MTQAIQNILDNAVSFSPPGGRVRLEVAKSGQWVDTTVEDEGPGVGGEHRDRMFDRFFTYRPDNREPNQHMGLGLPIAKAIIESYGGRIELRDRTAGACFAIRLPLHSTKG
jgi:two-component system sensor histidine kinase ChvG